VQFDLIIVGGGAAGLWAAAKASECGCRTLLLEKNSQIGVKILMSGGTRCNITHATDDRGIVDAFAAFDKKQAAFLRSALATLPPQDVIELIESEGVATKVEKTGKIFPVSNRAIDVRDALVRRAIKSGAQIQTDSPVESIQKESESFVIRFKHTELKARRVLITSGGQSYPGCGTTGDGYAWAKKFGHTIVNPVPALTPITTNEDWVTSLKGLTMDDASISVVRRDQERESTGYGVKQFLDTRRSSLLFTHFGFSGPAALDISRVITRRDDRSQLCLVCDFVTTVKFETLLTQLTNRFRDQGKKNVITILPEFVPRRLAEAVIVKASVSPNTRAAELSKKQIRKLVIGLKSSLVPISGTLGFKKAEVTGGGVSLAEVDSRTMQSKLVAGLYFAGEVLDIDGPIGGFNFQAAFSTGRLAGEHAARDY